MNFARKIKMLIFFFFIFYSNSQNSIALENKILFKIDSEIITTIDIYEEIKFLKIFNPEINSLSKEELFEISKNSILKDRIKKIEILNYVKELKVDDKFLLNLARNKYSIENINSLENLDKYLIDNNLDINTIKEKFAIELIWNDIIYQKFSEKIKIDKEKIKKEILQNPKRENQRELLLSEIVFNINDKIEFEKKYKKILLDIKKLGFKKSAIIHSNSDTASNGGLIGWVKEDNLNQSIKKVISKLQPGQFSKPIRTSSGFIIVKIEDKKVYKSEFNLNKKIDEVIRFKTNYQLNQFSSIYFNRLKKNLSIYCL